MKSIPLLARIYILLLILTTVVVVARSVSILTIDLIHLAILLVVAVAIAGLDAVPVHIYGEDTELTLSGSVKFAAVLLFSPPFAIMAAFLGTLMSEVPVRREWFKKAFNVSVMTLTVAVVAVIYNLLHQPDVDYFGSVQNILALVIAGLADLAVNSTLVTLMFNLAMRVSFSYFWLQNYSQLVLHELSMMPLGAFLAVLWRFNPISVALAGLPLFVVRHAYTVANDLQQQTHDALYALMRVVDERDHNTYNHSERVSNYARAIAEALNLTPKEIRVIAPAALLHDLGKVGMVDEILFSPKVLNPNERVEAQAHAEIGADLLSRFPLFQEGANLVRHHHERYDGKGYPDGLKGDSIPIGSRIISVADSYQAMTEERPYRRALSREEAVAQLVQNSGTQFDPRVVEVFTRILPALSAEEDKLDAVAPLLEKQRVGAEAG